MSLDRDMLLDELRRQGSIVVAGADGIRYHLIRGEERPSLNVYWADDEGYWYPLNPGWAVPAQLVFTKEHIADEGISPHVCSCGDCVGRMMPSAAEPIWLLVAAAVLDAILCGLPVWKLRCGSSMSGDEYDADEWRDDGEGSARQTPRPRPAPQPPTEEAGTAAPTAAWTWIETEA